MNLALDFGVSENLPARKESAVMALAHRFSQEMQHEDSPVRAVHHEPARPARFADFPSALDSRLQAALTTRGIGQLYSHQAASIEASLRGENAVVVTPTASGKTLCYNLPVLHRIIEHARRACDLPFSDQGAGGRSTARTRTSERSDGFAGLLPHLRRRHASRRAPRHPRESECRDDESRTCCTPESCRTIRNG